MIKLELATKENQLLYKNVFNMYQYELSQYLDEYSMLDDEGYFNASTTDVYFGSLYDKYVFPYVIYDDLTIIGVIVVSTGKYTAPETDYCIQEFMILPKYRRMGLGIKVIEKIIELYKEKGVLIALRANTNALAFWNKCFERLEIKCKKDFSDINTVVFYFNK